MTKDSFLDLAVHKFALYKMEVSVKDHGRMVLLEGTGVQALLDFEAEAGLVNVHFWNKSECRILALWAILINAAGPINIDEPFDIDSSGVYFGAVHHQTIRLH